MASEARSRFPISWNSARQLQCVMQCNICAMRLSAEQRLRLPLVREPDEGMHIEQTYYVQVNSSSVHSAVAFDVRPDWQSPFRVSARCPASVLTRACLCSRYLSSTEGSLALPLSCWQAISCQDWDVEPAAVQSRAPLGSTAAAAPEQARALLEATASTSVPQAASGAATAAAHSGLPVLAARVSTAPRERLSSVTLQSLVSASNDVLEQVRGAPAQSATDILCTTREARNRCCAVLH